MSVQQFRKRPVVVSAVQWTGGNLAEVEAFLGADFAGWRNCTVPPVLLIRTLENPDDPFQAPAGWWVLEGVAGEHYACEPGIFAQTYEAPRRRWYRRLGFHAAAVGWAIAGVTVATIVQDFTGSAGWADVAGIPMVVLGVFGLFWWRRRAVRRG